nr:hypothetical protein [Tanacetum cinerariifolium]
MLESEAYKTYYTFASEEKTPKPKYVQKKADSDTSPKQKPVKATKGTRIKTKATVAKSDKKKQPAKMPKAKGLAVVLDVPIYASESDKEYWGDSDEEDDEEDDFEEEADINNDDSNDNDESDDERTKSDSDVIPDPNLTNVEQTEHKEEDIDERVQIPSDYELIDDEKIYNEEY